MEVINDVTIVCDLIICGFPFLEAMSFVEGRILDLEVESGRYSAETIWKAAHDLEPCVVLKGTIGFKEQFHILLHKAQIC